MCMTVNIDKMKVMIIKSQKTTYDTFLCEKNSLAIWDKKKLYFILLSLMLFYMDVKFLDPISLRNLGER
jgi:hypothetical protein